MNDMLLREKMTMPDPNFSMKYTRQVHKSIDKIVEMTHWHKEVELIRVTKGSLLVKCNNRTHITNVGDLVIINCNELHAYEVLSEVVEYDCIILDPMILNSRFVDLCDSKYITPISQNKIVFETVVYKDQRIFVCVDIIVNEYNEHAMGFELAIKSSLLNLVVMLMRNHIKEILSDSQVKQRIRNIQKFNEIMHFLDLNYRNTLTLEALSDQAHLSKYHFCRLFKEMTGQTVTAYINSLRIQEASRLLETTDMTMVEIAELVGFNDTSYFSKTYKMIKKCTPTMTRKKRIADANETTEK